MSEQQKYFSTQDGTSLFYRYHPAADGSSVLQTSAGTIQANFGANGESAGNFTAF